MPTESAEVLRELLTTIYTRHGVDRGEAAVVSKHQVLANLAGHDSHGVLKTPQYIGAIKKGDLVPGAAFVVEQETESTAVIDANWGFGFVQTERAMELAIAKAAATGASGVTIRYQGHVGRLGAYTGMAAERDMIAMMMSDSGRGPKITAPVGGRTALLGSNPLCIAVPSARHGAVILDMATSSVALGKIRVAQARGERIPLGWIIDKDGNPTTDPDDYDAGGAMLPFGGDQAHKGYGLAFMVEIFCGILTGLGHGVAPDGKHNDGNFLGVFDVSRFMTPERFKNEVSDFIDYLKEGAAPGAEVLFPGEIEQRTIAERTANGVPVEDETWAKLVALREG